MMVSIITPAHNVESCLGRCIDSLLDQTFSDFELLLIDDGSTDATASICKQYQSGHERIKVFTHRQNLGVSAARNTGLKEMTGDFVCFVDSDDFVEPDYLESLLQGMDDSDACVCGYTTGDAEYYLSSRIYERKRFVQCLFELEDNGLLGYLWNKLFRADIICRQNIRFNERLSLWEDLLFVWDYLLHTEKIRVKEDILYHYISRGGSLMESNISYKAMTCYTFEIRNRLAELAPSDYLPLVHNQFFRYIMICLYNLYVKIHVPKKERMAFLRQLHPFVGHYPYRHPKRRPVSYRFIYRMLALDKGMYISDFVLTVWGKTKKYS